MSRSQELPARRKSLMSSRNSCRLSGVALIVGSVLSIIYYLIQGLFLNGTDLATITSSLSLMSFVIGFIGSVLVLLGRCLRFPGICATYYTCLEPGVLQPIFSRADLLSHLLLPVSFRALYAALDTLVCPPLCGLLVDLALLPGGACFWPAWRPVSPLPADCRDRAGLSLPLSFHVQRATADEVGSFWLCREHTPLSFHPVDHFPFAGARQLGGWGQRLPVIYADPDLYRYCYLPRATLRYRPHHQAHAGLRHPHRLRGRHLCAGRRLPGCALSHREQPRDFLTCHRPGRGALPAPERAAPARCEPAALWAARRAVPCHFPSRTAAGSHARA